MYFPYLFGRRYELLALRDVCNEIPLAATVVPVIEPVKTNPRDLKLCLQVLGPTETKVIVVVNPQLDEFRGHNSTAFRRAMADEFALYPSVLPGFVCSQHFGSREATAFLTEYPGRHVAILYLGPQFTNAELSNLIAEQRVMFHINLRDQMSRVQREMLPADKAVDIHDRFNAQARNADYAGSEYFTDSHLNFRANSVGYGDYSVIGSAYREAGGPAHAVAIHAVFKQLDTGELWVEHFISDDVDRDVGRVEEKFHQAATKLVREVQRRRTEFGHNGALASYASSVARNHFPGLGDSKRRQIHHHIATNFFVLRGEL